MSYDDFRKLVSYTVTSDGRNHHISASVTLVADLPLTNEQLHKLDEGQAFDIVASDLWKSVQQFSHSDDDMRSAYHEGYSDGERHKLYNPTKALQ